MQPTNERYITDADGNRTGVLLDMDTYRRLIEAEEDLEDLRASAAARAEDPEGLPLDAALAEIEAERAARKAS